MMWVIHALARRRFNLIDMVGFGVLLSMAQQGAIAAGFVFWVLLLLLSAWAEVETGSDT